MADNQPDMSIDMVMIEADDATISLATLPKRHFIIKLASIVTVWQALHGFPSDDGLTFIIDAIEADIRNWKDGHQNQVIE